MARTSARKRYAKEAVEASTIVLVDNDLSVLRALSRLIEIAGYRVIAFDRPNALLASAIPKTNVCAVIDVNLREMDGRELCGALAAFGRSLPTVLITGSSDVATRRLIEEAHSVAALFKPFDECALFEAIARALALSKGE